jgi:hypothetical protein
MHEGFDIGWSDEEAPGYSGPPRTQGAMSGGNVWPDDRLIPGFKDKVLEY